MKLWKIFRFEFAHQMRSLSNWIYLTVLLAFTFIMNTVTTPGDGIFANNTFYITSIIVIGSLIWLVMCAPVAGEAASRDVQTRMHTLLFTSPITKFDYLGGRLLAAIAINSLMILCLPAGVLLSFYLPGMNQEGLLPFRLAVYLNVYFLIGLPNVFFVTVLQFTSSALSHRVMTSYIASLILSIFPQLIAATSAQLFGNWDLIKLLDPVGIAGIIGSELSTWNPTQKNTRLLTLEGMFLWNRIFWLGIGAASLLFTYKRFSFNHSEANSWWSGLKRLRRIQSQKSDENIVSRPITITTPQAKQNFTFVTHLNQTFRIAQKSLGMIAKSPAGLLPVAAIAAVSAAFSQRIISVFGIPLLPTTQQILDFLTASVGKLDSPWVVIPLLIIFFSGRLVWSERDGRINDLVDTTPVREWALFAGKFIGLAFIIVVWMALLMAGGILMQLNFDYHNFETTLYAKVLFVFQLVEYLLFALLALVVHIVVNQKKLGYLAIFLVFIFIAFPSTFSIEHNLLVFGAGPAWTYTDMRGFGTTALPWLWFKLYWIAWALLLAVAAKLLWPRGKEQDFKHRFKSVKHRFTRSTARLVTVVTVFLVMVGGFVFYNTNVLNEYLTTAEANDRKAQYELRYGKYRNTANPQLISTKMNVDIYPDQRQVKIRAAYTLVNKHSVAIDSIHLGTTSDIALQAVKFSRPASNVVADKEVGHYIYELKKPLLPGDSLQVTFIVHHEHRGFRHNGIDASVTENGTSLTNYDLLPVIGYIRQKEITDAVTRKSHHLPSRAAIPLLYDKEARKKPMYADHNTFEAIVSTTKNQIAIAPGALQRTWKAEDRSYFHYKTNAPLRGEYAFLSGNYAVKQNKWNDIDISIYYHPGHHLNVDRILRSVKASLSYYTEQFGPYPYKHITITEKAGDGDGASAEASMICYGEKYSLMNPDDSPGGFDLPYYIMAHEVAHQWFGSAQITPANVEGAGVLIEGLAVYSGMQVLKKNYGDGHLKQYLNFLHSLYERPRALATASLLQANESFLYYRKGGLAMYTLSKYIGEEKVNYALRNLLRKHHEGMIPLPTTLDLYQELQDVTPDTLNYLLQDSFEKNTYWRLKAKELSIEQTTKNNWEATIKVQAQKVIVDSTGLEKDVPMNDWLEVSLYEQGEGSKSLYLRMHRIHSGEQTIKVTVPRKPKHGGIDPNYLMIDLRRDDNIIQIRD